MKVLLAESAQRVGVVFLALGGALLLTSAWTAWRSGWVALPVLALGVLDVARGLQLRQARVELDDDGFTVHAGGLRGRRVGWDDVDGLRLETPDLHVDLEDGTTFTLPRLPADQAREFWRSAP